MTPKVSFDLRDGDTVYNVQGYWYPGTAGNYYDPPDPAHFEWDKIQKYDAQGHLVEIENDLQEEIAERYEDQLDDLAAAVPEPYLYWENTMEIPGLDAKTLYGISKQDACKLGICIQCRQPALPNCYSGAGRREYYISGLCEKCFDSICGEE